MAKAVNKHFYLLHLIVFIWGFSPVLGRFITASAWQLVWFRVFITSFVLLGYLLVMRRNLRLSRQQLLRLGGIGLIILIHWLTFYGAIKVSNISVTMVAFSTGTLFSSIIEPVFFKRKVRPYEVAIGCVIIGAISLIFSLETQYWSGILLGIIAAFTSSLFGVLNGVMARTIEPAVISFYEITAAFIGMTLFVVFTGQMNSTFLSLNNQAMLGIGVLSLVCTVFPFIASVSLARYISPYTIVLTVNLETVYGIIWAILFYNENNEVRPEFYIGVVIILAAIFMNSYLKKLSDRKLGSNS